MTVRRETGSCCLPWRLCVPAIGATFSVHAGKGTAIFGFIEASALSGLLESINVTNADGSVCPECAAYEWNVTPSHIATSALDLVCGRHVSVSEATPSEYEGELFFFCSVGCRDRFVLSPQSFLPRREAVAREA